MAPDDQWPCPSIQDRVKEAPTWGRCWLAAVPVARRNGEMMAESKQMEKVAEEAARETRAAQRQREMAAENRELWDANTALTADKRSLENKLERQASAPNKVHLGVCAATGAVTAMGGFKVNRFLREKTSDWLDEQGERTTGAKVVCDILPPAVGLGVAGIGLVVKGGIASSSLIGGGLGFAAGSAISTLLVG